MEYDVQDKRPISAAEARRGVEAVKENWPAEDQAWLRELPANEAGVALLLAGELGAVPCNDSEIDATVETTSSAPTLQPQEFPEAPVQLELLGLASKEER